MNSMHALSYVELVYCFAYGLEAHSANSHGNGKQYNNYYERQLLYNYVWFPHQIIRYIGKHVKEVNTRLACVQAPLSIARLPDNIQKGSSWKGIYILLQIVCVM